MRQRVVASSWVSLLALCGLFACGGGSRSDDGGTMLPVSEEDAGAVEEDAGTALIDAGVVTSDGGTNPPAGKIRLEITQLRNEKGKIFCSLFTNDQGFPHDYARARASRITTPSAGSALCEFTDFQAGSYALAFIHDENNNDKLDTGFLGIPTEGYGVSNNATGRFGPPSFEDAKFVFDGRSAIQRVRAIY